MSRLSVDEAGAAGISRATIELNLLLFENNWSVLVKTKIPNKL